MRVVEALREAGRDISSGTTPVLLLACAFAATVGAVSFVPTAFEVAAVEQARAWVASGAATLVQQAEGRIDGEACDALATLSGVQHAGAVRASPDPVTPAALPSETVPVFEISAGFPGVVGQHESGLPGLLISRSVAESLGVGGGGVLRTAQGAAAVTAVYDHPDDGRDPVLAYAALSPALADGSPYDACLVTAWPADDDQVVPALARTLLTDGVDDDAPRPTTGQLNATHGASFDPLSTPGVGKVGAAACLVGLVLGVASVRRRRLSLASDRHVGVTPSAQVVTSAAQALVFCALGASGVFALTLWTTSALDAVDAGPLLAASGRTLVLGGLGCMSGTAVGALLIREASLFRHLQER